jgi:2-phospho-L-lactate guanylyltransferase
MDLIAVIPVKPFGVAKARLEPELDAANRARLGKSIAARTAAVAAEAGAAVIVVTGDDGVAAWADDRGLDVLREDPRFGAGLDGAAAAGVAHAVAQGTAWAIVHADLPLVTADDLAVVFDAAQRGPVVCPSYDGGTNVLAGRSGGLAFSYGKGSFRRHLAAEPTAAVITTPGLALDLDAPRDLFRARHLGGGWLIPSPRP